MSKAILMRQRYSCSLRVTTTDSDSQRASIPPDRFLYAELDQSSRRKKQKLSSTATLQPLPQPPFPPPPTPLRQLPSSSLSSSTSVPHMRSVFGERIMCYYIIYIYGALVIAGSL